VNTKRVLLLGDFSTVHINLRNGLKEYGVNARVLSSGDGYKSIERDIDFSMPSHLSSIRRLALLSSKFVRNFPELVNNDVVQFVSPFFFLSKPLNDTFYNWFLRKFNKETCYLACSSDQGFYKAKEKGYLENLLYDPIIAIKRDLDVNGKNSIDTYNSTLFDREHKIVSRAHRIIAPSFDYFNYTKFIYNPEKVNFIPFPLDLNPLPYKENNPKGKLIFLHGIHNKRFHFKGSHFITEALIKLKNTYPNDVEIRIINSLSYQDYLKELSLCHVFVDQTDAYDIGMAALQALALGRITLSGSEEIINNLYLGRDNTVINIRPSAEYVYNKCVTLLENRGEIFDRSLRGRSYVEKNHSHVLVAKKYIDLWG
jgi:hypothetical protein